MDGTVMVFIGMAVGFVITLPIAMYVKKHMKNKKNEQ